MKYTTFLGMNTPGMKQQIYSLMFALDDLCKHTILFFTKTH